MQIRKRIKTGKPESEFDATLEQELHSGWLELATLLNGNLGFVENFNCAQVVTADTGTANTEFTVAHNLKRIPTGYLVISIDKAGVVYKSGAAWTAANIYLKCNVANTNVTVIVL